MPLSSDLSPLPPNASFTPLSMPLWHVEISPQLSFWLALMGFCILLAMHLAEHVKCIWSATRKETAIQCEAEVQRSTLNWWADCCLICFGWLATFSHFKSVRKKRNSNCFVCCLLHFLKHFEELPSSLMEFIVELPSSVCTVTLITEQLLFCWFHNNKQDLGLVSTLWKLFTLFSGHWCFVCSKKLPQFLKNPLQTFEVGTVMAAIMMRVTAVTLIIQLPVAPSDQANLGVEIAEDLKCGHQVDKAERKVDKTQGKTVKMSGWHPGPSIHDNGTPSYGVYVIGMGPLQENTHQQVGGYPEELLGL